MSKASKIVDLPKIDPKAFEKKDEAPTQLPVPKGWRMLIAIPEVESVTRGGIIKADSTKNIEQTSSVVGLILAMGDQCGFIAASIYWAGRLNR